MSSNRSDTGSLVDPCTGKAIGALRQPGYYPDLNTLAQQNFWDAKTREVVLSRVHEIPSVRFFASDESKLLQTICDHIIPQHDRDAAHKIPIVPWIDKRLYENRHDGYRFADMPPDREAFRLGFHAIEQIAGHLHGRSFIDLDSHEQELILKSLHDSKPAAGAEIWKRLPVHRFWMMLVQDCVEVYYAHPWAWDEIGFGGPAYPRAYMRLENGLPEPWEADERRYEWEAPSDSISDLREPIASAIEHSAPHPKRGSA
ncbi:MAG: gluconate 2-dehydrogenase subunit 3 family protein [Candidatus Binataceae bacterium]